MNMNSKSLMDLCRLCLVDSKALLPIFEHNKITSHKISTCLPINFAENDNLPQKICEECSSKVDFVYEFWNLTSLADQQLHAWLAGQSDGIQFNFVKETKADSSDVVSSANFESLQNGTSTSNHTSDSKEHSLENDVTAFTNDASDDSGADGNDIDFEASCSSPSPDAIPGPSSKSEQKKKFKVTKKQDFERKKNVKAAKVSKSPTKNYIKSINQKEKDGKGNRKSIDKPQNLPVIRCTSCFTDCQLDDVRINSVNKLVCKNCVDANFECPKLIGTGTEKNNYTCNVCFKEFKSKKVILRHLYVHQEDKPHVCDVCFKSFKRPESMNAHKKIHDKDHPMYTCDSCGFTTAHKKSLEMHCKRHVLDYTVKCEICGKGYYSNNELSDHMNIHTGAKPYMCAICGKAYPYKVNLLAHMKYAHNPTPKEPQINQCETCGKVYSFKRSLVLHKRTHTGDNWYVCDICGKVLSSKEHLKFHRRIHTGEKPNKCSFCGKGFAKSGNLTLHERVHTGEKPYTCEICGKCFSQRSTLTIHRRYHTGQRPYVCDICNRGFVCRALLTNHQKSPCAIERRPVTQLASLTQFVEVIQPL
ncbi:unnamed protein product [Bemisia tabaci]|uniref:Zinc finger protein n=1 Tax=Bemisia tabaci TaxID=7038 RepID=A0A9P0AJG3_BEMTA|nr:unnamed protein product [Bemisia tabaci]